MSDSSTQRTPWAGFVPVEDTALATTDSGGAGCVVVYLNGCYADQSHWRPVISHLGDSYRHIGFDERARGKSGRSSDYSFEACLRDLDAVLRHRGVARPILVGWSYGAFLAAHWADRFPDRTGGVVAVDGALPFGLTGDSGRAQIRRLFKRIGWVFPVASRLGLAARMSAAQHAEVNIEANEISGTCEPVLERITRPMRYVLATGGHLGGSAAVMEAGRATLGPVLERNPHLLISAKVASNHSSILKRDHRAVADAVREVASVLAEQHRDTAKR